ncbi:RICIN domain-containing protein [Zavarzinella formosa]|uniref:RICIN domain-containing protein n=1 Tax=Zavarzinella formosa TaxID=360055 RepID=UPI00037137B6|nr:RICIN domain-containing protein [Zavarzinella formosa]
MARLFAALAICLAIVAHPVRADEVSMAQEKVAKAREEYKSAVAAIRKDLSLLIDAKEATERKRPKPDLAKIKAIKEEKDTLEDGGAVPAWIDMRMKDRIAKAKTPLVTALTALVKAHILAKEDDKAALVEKELQRLKMAEALPATEAKFYRIVNKNSGLSVTIRDDIDKSEGSPTQEKYEEKASQQWEFIKQEKGDGVRIRNRKTGATISIPGESKQKGYGLRLLENPSEKSTDLWLLRQGKRYYHIVSVFDGLYMAVSEGSKNPGVGLIQWTAHDGDDELWELIPIKEQAPPKTK